MDHLAHRNSSFTDGFVPGQGASPPVWQWLAGALDELDYGIVVLFEGTSIVHLNDAAEVELDDMHPLQRVGNELRARLARDVAPLHEAVTAAATRGMRRLLTVGEETHRTSVSVVPLETADGGPRAVLMVLGKREMCESLSVRQATESVKSLALEDVYARVVRLLTDLSDAGPDGQRRVRERLTQQGIADRIGASREMVSRIFKDLGAGGYIAQDGGHIVVVRKLPTAW